MRWDGPILDNHLHLDDEAGAGLAAVEDFAGAGGTHLLVVNRPSWSHGVEVTDPEDFTIGYHRTVRLCEQASEQLPGVAWPVLGVHPALITRLTDERGMEPECAAELMCEGLDRAATFVADGPAVALKSGRPHYPVTDAVATASNQVLRHALRTAATTGCAIQLHTESTDALTEIARWAEESDLDRGRVVKHFAEGPITGPIPSVIARTDAISSAVAAGAPFLMETDFLDDPARPGAVLGPKTVPRRTRWLAEQDEVTAIQQAHVDTPARVYDIDTEETLVRTAASGGGP